MPEVLIYNIREPNKSKTVEYDFGDETLEEIVKKYDKKASTSRCRLAIGEEALTCWDIPIEACLEYGDSISIYETWSLATCQIFVKTPFETLTISINLDSTIEELKRKIEKVNGVPADLQRIIFNSRQHENGSTLRDCSIFQECTVFMMLRLLGGTISFANVSEDGKKFI